MMSRFLKHFTRKLELKLIDVLIDQTSFYDYNILTLII